MIDTPYELLGYADVPDYIYGITRAIWEDRGIGGELERFYAPDVRVRAATGLTVGNDGVVAQTLQTLHQFPDRQLVGEDVIWTEAPGRSFLSSHRLVSVMRHTGDGVLGAATGRMVRSRVIADCWVQDGMVKDEWLIRDQAAFALCLGLTPRELAERTAASELRATGGIGFFTPAADVAALYSPTVADDPVVEPLLATLDRLWTIKETAAIRRMYFAGAALHAPGGETYFGHQDIDQFVIGYLASFPDARLSVHSVVVNREPERPVRVAVRWSLEATHSGWGRFGEPSGAPVHIMAMSHLHVTGGRVHAEWLVIDDVSVWKQIIAHRESRAGA